MRTAEDIRRELDGGPNLTVVEPGPDGREVPPPATWRDRLDPRSAADLAGKPVRPRKWLVPDWIPSGHLTSIYGRGGGGKTTLAIQLGASTAIGAPWLGMATDRCRVLGVFCEDDEDELHRRFANAAGNLGRPLSDFGGLAYLPRLGLDNLLVARSPRGGLATTPFYDDLAEMIGDEKVGLGLFDGIADLFGGNINDPSESTLFLNKVVGLMRPTGGTAVLLGHPNKAGTSEFTGCGAWENKPRARLYLAPPPPRDGEEPDLNDPRRVLMRSKANYAARDSLDLAWKAGMFRVADPKLMSLHERCELEARQGKAREAFLVALGKLDAMQVHVSHSPKAGNFGPKEMIARGLVDGFAKGELVEAMNRLLGDGLIRANEPVGWSGNRNRLTGLRRVAP